MTFKERIHRVESALIAKALRQANGQITAAAKSMGLNHGQLQSVMRRHPELAGTRTQPRARRQSIFPKVREVREKHQGEWHREAL